MNRFLSELRSGQATLDLCPDSGWYDYQSYALEPLALPERALEAEKLWLQKTYKKHLLDAFRTLVDPESRNQS